jgi:CRP-like cAMP-binding protein
MRPGSRCSAGTRADQQIADRVGSLRETVTRVVKDLKQSGWLREEGKRYNLPPAEL